MSSGGDLDGGSYLQYMKIDTFVHGEHSGDEYFVCWDPDLVPARVAEVRVCRKFSSADPDLDSCPRSHMIILGTRNTLAKTSHDLI